MRSPAILLFLFSTLAIASTPISTQSTTSTASSCPFVTPIPLFQQPALFYLLPRQEGCPSGFDGCSNLGAPQACCSTDAICTPDGASHVACCPSGALCTGTLGQTAVAVATTLGGTIVSETGSAAATGTVTATNGIIVTVGSGGAGPKCNGRLPKVEYTIGLILAMGLLYY